MMPRTVIALLLMIGMMGSGSTFAQPDSSSSETAPRPLASLRISTFSGIPDFLSGSVSLTALRPLEIEAGANWYEFSFLGGTGRGYYVRGGYTHERRNYRNRVTGRGFTEHLGGAFGYRYNHSFDVFGKPYINHAATLTMGIEVAQWSGRHFGLSGHLSAGFDYWFKAEEPVFQKYRLTPDIRISAGVCF